MTADKVVIELDPDDAEVLADALVVEADRGFRELADDLYRQVRKIRDRQALIERTDEHLRQIDTEYPPSFADTCCGACPGGTCYVDQMTGER